MSDYNKMRRRLTAQQTGKCSYCPPHRRENEAKGHSQASVRDKRIWLKLERADEAIRD